MQQGIKIMDVIKRISELTTERGWSTYKLAQKSGLSVSTTFLDHVVAATWLHPLVKLVPDLFLCMIYGQSVRTPALYHK